MNRFHECRKKGVLVILSVFLKASLLTFILQNIDERKAKTANIPLQNTVNSPSDGHLQDYDKLLILLR